MLIFVLIFCIISVIFGAISIGICLEDGYKTKADKILVWSMVGYTAIAMTSTIFVTMNL